MPWVLWLLAGAVALRAAAGLLVLRDRRGLARRAVKARHAAVRVARHARRRRSSVPVRPATAAPGDSAVPAPAGP